MSFLSWLANRLILCPSTHTIDPAGKQRIEIPTPHGHVEAYVDSMNNDGIGEQRNQGTGDLVILKFPGTAGRAERAGLHPAELFEQFASEVWTINHHGYGQSSGPANILSFPEACDSVMEFIRARKGKQRSYLVTGNSLGSISALYVAARYPVTGMLLRNPVPVHQLISTRPKYAAWNFGMSSVVANQVPASLDAIENARQASAPCLFVQSERDRVVPPPYQAQIIDNYHAVSSTFVSRGTDHHEPVPENQAEAYLDSLRWLEKQMLAKND